MAKGSLSEKKRRQDELISCLRTSPYWTVNQLCDVLSASARTISRDIDELKASGIPIETERGRGGGIALRGRWGLGRLELANNEVMSLLLSLAITESIAPAVFSEHLTSIRHRIALSFPEGQRDIIQSLRERILIGNNASHTILSSFDFLNDDVMTVMTQSFFDTNKVEIEYQSENQAITTRVIEPQFLLLNWPVWYILSWDALRNDIRMFRVDRIKSVTGLKDKFRMRDRKAFLRGLEPYFGSL